LRPARCTDDGLPPARRHRPWRRTPPQRLVAL
jgi:hypothetical protein